MSPTYHPGIFDVRDINSARQIILTPEPGVSSDDRWETETPAVVDWIQQAVGPISKNMTVLDYGCGIGRISKALIEATGCSVIGVDLSASMRALAAHYVNSPRFVACPPEMLPRFLSCDVAISIWTLQHCLRPETDIKLIVGALRPARKLFVLNLKTRCVPTDRGWVNDGLDIRALLCRWFTEHDWHPPTSPLSPMLCEASFVGSYEGV